MADFPMCHDHYSTNSKFKVSVFSVTFGPLESIKQIVRMFYDPWRCISSLATVIMFCMSQKSIRRNDISTINCY